MLNLGEVNFILIVLEALQMGLVPLDHVHFALFHDLHFLNLFDLLL